MGCTPAYIFCRVELPASHLTQQSHSIPCTLSSGLNADDPIWLIILFTHHVCLPSANNVPGLIQHHQFHYCFNIPVADLTADIILTKLESLVKWDCLIPFLTEMLKNHLPALRSLLCTLIIQLSKQIGELISQWSLSLFLFINFYWNIALQGCVSFWGAAK